MDEKEEQLQRAIHFEIQKLNRELGIKLDTLAKDVSALLQELRGFM